MADMVYEKPDTPSWIRYIHQRVNRNKNFVCFIEGPTGSGKSWSGISICKMADPSFNAERIVFDSKELMDLIGSGKLKAGSAIMFEEVGVELDSHKWQSVQNMMLKYLFQTFRHERYILIMTAPFLDYIALGSRKLLHAVFTTQGINEDKKTCKLRPVLIQYNSWNRKMYNKFLRVVTHEGVVPISAWHVAKPDDEILDQYQQKKKAFTDALNQRILTELNKISTPVDKNFWVCNKCGHEWIPRREKAMLCANPVCKSKNIQKMVESSTEP